jgi:hypothetical protein
MINSNSSTAIDMSRRNWVAGVAAAACAEGMGLFNSAALLASTLTTQAATKPKSVAAILTAYEKGLHADVLIGKILEGWRQDGGPGPALKLSSMYLDQFTDRDMARGMSEKYNVPIFDSIEKAITVGGDQIPVDGVISIGEHGDYPWNELEQHLYPRRRFFKEITDTFVKYGRVVPVFNDKHLGPAWEDAKWMYDRAVELKVPFMAGSSMTVGERTPKISIPMGADIETAVGVGYSGLDIYGSHTLEFYQCHIERRRGAESGVRWVHCLEGDAVWKAVDEGIVPKELFDAAFAAVPHSQDNPRDDKQVALFQFEYVDGFRGFVFMLPAAAAGTSIAIQLKGQSGLLTTRFDEKAEPRHPHFAWLLKGIERMFHSGRPSYPVERTLLTSGILDRALTSRFRKHEKLMTPELAIRYQAVDYPHAPWPSLDSDPNATLASPE